MDNYFENSGNQQKSNKKRASGIKKVLKTFFIIIIAAVLLGSAGFGGYYYRDQSASSEISKKQDIIDNLNKTKASLEKQLAEANTSKKQSFAVASCNSTANKTISNSTIENIQASITSKNTAALDGRMTDTVCFAIAASDGIGDISKTNAIENLTNYLEDAGTWTFSPTSSEISSYKSGNYANFFVDGAIIGKSSDGKILLMSFNNAGKIDVIFWAATQSELM